ncbi:glycoside hydrolase family 3 protein [Bailinhaonella thermotolerans]|uniref:beta-N-acetylhexosaminidase n=1 Tax=Bailinhaonella thermotolerans TaxID=1070861 RepID=A0A3A4B402_9ACTN|nr:glycoside hydrolase family 3 protein [Bailinhaonella thermotolerans]RJL32749.1 glycoside hydrolase family 3 protein [Bailinhaonella thermotolerans]
MRYRKWAAVTTAVLLSAALAPHAQADAGGDRQIAEKIRRMTLEEKVGQLFLANVYGETADTTNPADVTANQTLYGPDVRNGNDLIAKYKLGGLVYFRWSNNLNEPAKIARLSNGLQRAALAQPAKIPLFISTDQENGVVYRLGDPATQLPGAMALGATRRPADAFASYAVTGRELRALGVNQDYAPVADVNVDPSNPVIGVRSFGEDPKLVSDMTAAAVRGIRSTGLASAIKHFPGHGDTVNDSHNQVPWIHHTREEWREIDAPPFAAGIRAGTDMVMTAHVVMPKLQSDCDEVTKAGCDPATLDPEILTGLLRGELGYDGVVVTDALNMKGVREQYGDERVPVLALKAGVDLLMMIDTTTDTVSLDVAYNAVLKAVRSGELTERRIDESVRRVLKLKKDRGLFRGDPYVDEGRAAQRLGTRAHVAVADHVSGHSVTLVRDDAKALPLAAAGKKFLVTGYRNVVNPTVLATPALHLAEALKEQGAAADLHETGTTPARADIDAAVAKANASDAVVVTTVNATGTGASATQQRALVEALIATGKPVIVVGSRNPYDINALPGARTFLASYDWSRSQMRATARVITGKTRPTGKLPVTIPAAGGGVLYPYGHGLTY